MLKDIINDAKFLYGPNSELEQLRAKRIESQRIAAELKEINKRMDEEHERIRLETLVHFKEQLEQLRDQSESDESQTTENNDNDSDKK